MADTESKETPVIPDEIPAKMDNQYMIPKKEIYGPDDIQLKWEKSQAYEDLIGFMMAMNEAVKGKKMRDECHVSKTTEKILGVLETLDGWITEIPAIDQPQRFGNKAFREWFEKLENNAEGLVRDALEERHHAAVPEITKYLVEGVGNKTRIDYGTGHELAFAAFLCCLFKVEAFTQEDSVAVTLKVFQRYLELARRLQQTYRMEPAGSHGVYSLDDYHFLPFFWGSAQLLNHPRIHPKSFPNPEIAEGFAKDFMFLSAVHYINQVKTGPFAEHSNQLWNVSGVQLWSKVNSGLMKMYKAEVLAKFPVIQHFLFGSLLSVQPTGALS